MRAPWDAATWESASTAWLSSSPRERPLSLPQLLRAPSTSKRSEEFSDSRYAPLDSVPGGVFVDGALGASTTHGRDTLRSVDQSYGLSVAVALSAGVAELDRLLRAVQDFDDRAFRQ